MNRGHACEAVIGVRAVDLQSSWVPSPSCSCSDLCVPCLPQATCPTSTPSPPLKAPTGMWGTSCWLCTAASLPTEDGG